MTQGGGIFDYAQLNTRRLRSFHSSDVRIDKKYNLKSITIDVFLDVTNWYIAAADAVPYFAFKRTDDNKGFATTDGRRSSRTWYSVLSCGQLRRKRARSFA